MRCAVLEADAEALGGVDKGLNGTGCYGHWWESVSLCREPLDRSGKQEVEQQHQDSATVLVY
jgi:hypothetical protein